MNTLDAPVENPPTSAMSDDALFDEMRAQITWARNENPAYSIGRFREVMTEMAKRGIITPKAK